MAKYYAFYEGASPPYAVRGWIDTDLWKAKLPETVVEMTDDEWAHRVDQDSQWFFNGTRLIKIMPEPEPANPLQDEYDKRLAEGVRITSQSDAALSFTIGLDPASETEVGRLARDIGANLGLPDDAPTVPIDDSSGDRIELNAPQITALYKAMRNVLHRLHRALEHGGKWPDQKATIP